ncbi:MAG: hypothetical protein LBB38_01855 [Puniceicoccales bacterium]|nr:hypothetical protein [Puniceicoccales bacterium]
MEILKKGYGAFRLASRRRLSGGGGKEICEIILEADGQLAYEPGDWLAVAPQNCREDVSRLLAVLAAPREMVVKLREGEMAIGQALSECFTIGEVPRQLAELIATRCEGEKAKILGEAIDGDFNAFASGLSVCEFLETFAVKDLPIPDVLASLRPLQPRLYSIASCPFSIANGLRLIVTTATHLGRDGKLRFGVASSHVNRRLSVGDVLRAKVVSTKFRLPADPNVDVLMVGPGAGLAPFIGFLERREWERKEKNSHGRNWLFFGDRHRATDFIEENRLMAWLESGLLARLDLAFSRDQEKKIYVQDRIRENGEEFHRWLADGAHFYICGDGKRMAVDVEAAVLETFTRFGNLPHEAALEKIGEMKRSRRFQRDVY